MRAARILYDCIATKRTATVQPEYEAVMAGLWEVTNYINYIVYPRFELLKILARDRVKCV